MSSPATSSSAAELSIRWEVSESKPREGSKLFPYANNLAPGSLAFQELHTFGTELSVTHSTLRPNLVLIHVPIMDKTVIVSIITSAALLGSIFSDCSDITRTCGSWGKLKYAHPPVRLQFLNNPGSHTHELGNNCVHTDPFHPFL